MKRLSLRSKSARSAASRKPVIFHSLEPLEPRVFLSAADPGNTLATARDLGTIGNAATVSESVGGIDAGDIYAFSVARASNLTVTISGLTKSAQIDLIQDTNNDGQIDPSEIIATASSGTAHSATLTAPVNGGSFFIHVTSTTGAKTSYSLKLVNVPQPGGPAGDIYEPDDTAAQASTIIPNATTQTHSLNTPADVDWAKFTLTQTTGVTIQTNGAHGDTELQLFSAADTTHPLLSDNDSGTGLFSLINTNLAAGTYFVRVSDAGRNAISSYTLAVRTHTTVPSAPTVAALGRPLGVVLGKSTIQGTLGGASNNIADLYNFSVVQPIIFSVQVTTPILGWQLSIFDAAGNRVQPTTASSFITGGNANTEVFALGPGSYSMVIQEPLPLVSTFGLNTVQAAGTPGVPGFIPSAATAGFFLNLPNIPVGVVGADLTVAVGNTGVLGGFNPLPAQPYTLSLDAVLQSEVGIINTR